MAGPSLTAPFTVIDKAYSVTFTTLLNNSVGAVEAAVVPPLLACVTIWIIIQGVLVMRGDIDTRRGVTKLIMVAIVVSLVGSADLYREYVQEMFETAIPHFVQQLGGNAGIPTKSVPLALDAIFRVGEKAFQTISAEIAPSDTLDSIAFEGAQVAFYFTLWSIFCIYDLIGIMTSVLVAVGPIFIIGFLFDATRDMAIRWVGQLVSYAILLLLTSIVAAIVVFIIGVFMTGSFLLTLIGGTEAGQIVGLYEMDAFILTGNALIVALPAIAGQIGGGVGASGGQMFQSIIRHIAGVDKSNIGNTLQNIGMTR